MDAGRLFGIFAASFSPDPNARVRAELELREFEGQEGLLTALVSLLPPREGASTTERDVDAVRLAVAIYVKNRVLRSWDSSSEGDEEHLRADELRHAPRKPPIPTSDRIALKHRVVALVARFASSSGRRTSDPVARQVRATFAKIVDSDFPREWPSLAGDVVSLLSSQDDLAQVETGLLAAVYIFRRFRYVRNDTLAEQVAETCASILPSVLSVARNVLAHIQPADAHALTRQCTLLHLACKAYRHSISSILTPYHQHSLVDWGSFLLDSVVQRDTPTELLPSDQDSFDACEWSRQLKWAVQSLNTLFTRYGNPSQMSKSLKVVYGAVAERFVDQFAPQILRAYLSLIERIANGEPAARKVQYALIDYLTESLRPKQTWEILKPHALLLIEGFLFPRVHLTDDTLNQFEHDPHEFARETFVDFVELSFSNPGIAALSFVSQLVDARASQLVPVLNFIQQVVSTYPAQATYTDKDAALRILAAIAPTAVKSKKLGPMMERFFIANILPEFQSLHAVLRYRACEVVNKFESEDMQWENKENLHAVLAATLNAVTDASLPVKIEAVLTLPELARYEEVRAKMVPNIGRIMQELFALSNEIDLDPVSDTLRSLITEFHEEVIPFALEVTQQLLFTYSRLLQEIIEARRREDEDDADDFAAEEKSLVCMNTLRTIEQVIGSLDRKGPIPEIESAVVPQLILTIQANLVELYEEVFSLLDTLIFEQRSVNPSMWPAFETIYRAFKGEAHDCFDQMHPVFDDFVCYGRETFAARSDYRQMLLDTFSTVMTSPRLGAEDRAYACQLGEAMMLNLTGICDEAVPVLIERAVAAMFGRDDDPNFPVTTSLFLHALNLVVAAIHYDAPLAFSVLDAKGWTVRFCQEWLKHLSKLVRVYDRKLTIAAICAILGWVKAIQQAAIAQYTPQLLAGALVAFKDLPAAINDRRNQQQSLETTDDNADALADADDLEDLLDAEDDDGDVLDGDADFLERVLADKDSVASETSLWSDEVLWQSPLDDIDVFALFATTMQNLRVTSSNMFEHATRELDDARRAQMEEIVSVAAAGGEKSQQF